MMSRRILIWAILVLCPNLAQAESTPLTLATGELKNAPRQPQAFVSGEGTVDVVYAVDDEIRLATSHDRGATFKSAASAIQSRASERPTR